MSFYITLSIFGETFEFRTKKLSRKNLYGCKKIVAKNGEEDCEKSYVNETGMITLTNGCTKFFSPAENEDGAVEGISKASPQKINKQALFEKGLLGSFFSIGKDRTFNAEQFLEMENAVSYQLICSDKNQMSQAMELLGSEIRTDSIHYSDNVDVLFYIFANENGIFICLCDYVADKFLYEENLISDDNELEVLDEGEDIDFENLW